MIKTRSTSFCCWSRHENLRATVTHIVGDIFFLIKVSVGFRFFSYFLRCFSGFYNFEKVRKKFFQKRDFEIWKKTNVRPTGLIRVFRLQHFCFKRGNHSFLLFVNIKVKICLQFGSLEDRFKLPAARPTKRRAEENVSSNFLIFLHTNFDIRLKDWTRWWKNNWSCLCLLRNGFDCTVPVRLRQVRKHQDSTRMGDRQREDRALSTRKFHLVYAICERP